MEFTSSQMKFIFECIEKELFFAEWSDTFVKTIGDIVEAELQKESFYV